MHSYRSRLVSTLGALAFAGLGAAPALAQMPGNPGGPQMAIVPMLVTNGRGEVESTPDMATIDFSVESRSATAADAGRRNAAIQTAVLDTLRRMGFSKDQLSTLGYSVMPEYQYPKEGGVPKVVGYVARNTVRAQARKIEMVGSSIDAALAKGATTVASLRFESSTSDATRREGLRLAVRNARADAEAMADAAGGSLGDLIDISTTDLGPVPMMEMAQMQMARSADAPTPISPGQQKVAVMITARWRFVAGARK